MDSSRQPEHERSNSDHSENSGSLIDALDRDRGASNTKSVGTVLERSQRQAKKRELHCVTYTTGVLAATVEIAPVLFPLGIHLPDDSEIGSLYVENRTPSGIIIYEGPGGGGRIIAYAGLNSWRVVSISDGISSVSLVVDTTATVGPGLVIATLFSHKWAPRMGTIV